MCRLLGYVAATPTSVRRLIGDENLAQFTALTVLHGDGWGSYWTDGVGQHVHRSITSAAADPDYARALDEDAAARILHLRWATEGYRVEAANTHPFLADGIAFAHNGNIEPTGPLDDLLTSRSRAGLAGATDSERYFALIRQEMAFGDAATAAVRAAGALRAHYPSASLNALLLTEAELIIVHANSVEGAPLAELSALPGGAPPDHLSAYFLMRWMRTADDSLVFASSGMPAGGWTPLPEETVTAVDLRTRVMRHLPLAVHAAGRSA